MKRPLQAAPPRNDARSPEAQAYRKLYDSQRWRNPKHGVRARQLRAHPLCQRCERRGVIIPATEVHHNPPHRGDVVRFYGGPFESLCHDCHNGDARHDELHGFSAAVGEDGLPLDPRHPANR